MKTYSLSRLPLGGLAHIDASGDANDPAEESVRPAGGCARGEGNQDSAPSPQRAVVRVDGVSAYRGPADIALFYFGRWSAEHPEKNVTIEEEA